MGWTGTKEEKMDMNMLVEADDTCRMKRKEDTSITGVKE